MKPVLRFSSMNSFRASCSDAEREYIVMNYNLQSEVIEQLLYVIVREYGQTLGLGLVDRDRTIDNY